MKLILLIKFHFIETNNFCNNKKKCLIQKENLNPHYIENSFVKMKSTHH